MDTTAESSDNETVKPSVDNSDVVKILAWDYSGSTHGQAHYHQNGKKYLNDFVNSATTASNNKPIYLTWTSSCSEVTLEQLYNICDKMEGTQGTYPSTMISWILNSVPNDKPIELWLITDGEIGASELQNCSSMNKALNYSRINFIVINRGRINMSVGASFFRGAELNIFLNDSLYKAINTSQPYEYDAISLDNFDSKWDHLSDFIQAKFMGSDMDGLLEVEKLSALKQRLMNSIQEDEVENDAKYPNFPSKRQADMIETLKTCQFYKNLTNSTVKTVREKIDASINTLINYIHNKHRSYNFSTLKVEYKQSKMQEIKDEAEPEIDNLDDLDKCVLFDAVTLENEENVPVLLLSITDLIEKYWLDGNYSKFRTIMDCPLLAQLDTCIGHVYTYSTFKSLCSIDEGILTNPLTNQPVFGGLIFDEAADDWNDYVISKSFFRGKKVNTSLALWYYVIWDSARHKPWIESAVVDLIKSYAFRRMQRGKVRLGFGKLPLDPKEIVPIHVACFYNTIGASLLFGKNYQLFLQEKLRQYWPVAESMLNILDHFGYDDIDKEFVVKRAKVFEVMSQLKRIPQAIEKRYFLLENCFEKQGEFLTYILKDENALRYTNLLKYHHNTSVIPFDFDDSPVDVRSWVVVSYEPKSTKVVDICQDTYRPYFVVKTDSDGLVCNYRQIMDNNVQVNLAANGEMLAKSNLTKLNQKQLISCAKLYIDFTAKGKKFPKIDEFSKYVWQVKQFSDNKIRLFSPETSSEIQNHFDSYSELNVGVDEFIDKTNRSVHVTERVKMEGRLLDKDADEFIKQAKEMLGYVNA